MRRRPLAASLAVLVAALLTGCVALPTSGPVGVGHPDPVEESLELDTFVRSPQPGDSPEDIVQGFIDAAASPRGNYAAAQQYLTEEFKDEWRPDARATIDVRADRVVEAPDVSDDATETQVQVATTPVAALTDVGQYEQPESTAEAKLPYRLVTVDGEWRIAEAPQGLLVDELTFGEVYRSYELYFYSLDYRYLVPDLRWFARTDAVQTNVVRALLGGPGDWLAAGVATAFPEGTALEQSSVPIANGTASVDLSGAQFDDTRTLQRMQAQLDESLVGQVRNVDSVALSIDGAAQDPPPLADPPIQNPAVDPRPVVYDGETFGYLAASNDEVQPIEGVSEQVAALAPTGAAVGAGGTSVAVRSEIGVSIVRSGDDPVTLDPRAGSSLIVPAIDPQGVVWSVPTAAPGELVAYPPEGDPIPMAVPWIGSTISSLEVSRDGTRIIALLGDGTRARFVAASIERDADGVPIGLGKVALALTSVSGAPRDVAWLDANRVAALVEMPGGDTRVLVQEIGGVPDDEAGPADGRMLDAGNGERSLRVLTAEGALEVPSGVTWQERASGFSFVSVQMPG